MNDDQLARLDALNYTLALLNGDSAAARAATQRYTAEQLRDSLAINQVQLFSMTAEVCRANSCECIEAALDEYQDRLLDRAFDDPSAA